MSNLLNILYNTIFMKINKFLFFYNMFFLYFLRKILKAFFLLIFLLFLLPIKVIYPLLRDMFYFAFNKTFSIMMLLIFNNWLKKLLIILALFSYYYFFFHYFFSGQFSNHFYFSYIGPEAVSFNNFTYQLALDFLNSDGDAAFSKTSPFVQFYNDFPNFLESITFPLKIKTKFDISYERGIQQFYFGSLLQHSRSWFSNIDSLDYWILRNKYLKGWSDYGLILDNFEDFSFLYYISSVNFYFRYFLDVFCLPILFFVEIKYALIHFVNLFFKDISFLKDFFMYVLFLLDDLLLVNLLFVFKILLFTISQLFFDDLFGIIFRYLIYLKDHNLIVESFISTIFYDSFVDLFSYFHKSFPIQKNNHYFGYNLYSYPNYNSVFIFSIDPSAFFGTLDFSSSFTNLNSYHYYTFYEVPYYLNTEQLSVYPIIDTQFFYFYDLFSKNYTLNDFYYSRILNSDFFSLEEFFYRDFFDFWFYSDFFKSKLNYNRKLTYMSKLFEYILLFNENNKFDFFGNFTSTNNYHLYSDFYRKYFNFLDISMDQTWRFYRQNSFDIPFKNVLFWSSYTYVLLHFLLVVFYKVAFLFTLIVSQINFLIPYYIIIQLLFIYIYVFSISFLSVKLNIIYFYKVCFIIIPKIIPKKFFFYFFILMCLCILVYLLKFLIILIEISVYYILFNSKNFYYNRFISYIKTIFLQFNFFLSLIYTFLKRFCARLYCFDILFFVLLYIFNFVFILTKKSFYFLSKIILFFFFIYFYLLVYYFYFYFYFSITVNILNNLENHLVNPSIFDVFAYQLTLEDTNILDIFVI